MFMESLMNKKDFWDALKHAVPTESHEVKYRYEEHIKWLKPFDEFSCASKGFMRAVNFMLGTNNTALIPEFLKRVHHLDKFRNENFFEVFPELARLKEHG